MNIQKYMIDPGPSISPLQQTTKKQKTTKTTDNTKNTKKSENNNCDRQLSKTNQDFTFHPD